jgi:hypothetical protein
MHQFLVDAVGCDGVVELAGAVVADRSEEGAFGIGRVAGFLCRRLPALAFVVERLSRAGTVEVCHCRGSIPVARSQDRAGQQRVSRYVNKLSWR